MPRHFLFLLVLLAGLISCNNKGQKNTETSCCGSEKTQILSLSDPEASCEARQLYAFIGSLGGEHTLFGHQDALSYGIEWWAEDFRSDVHGIIGDHPAVFGWDLGHMGDERNIDSVSFENMKNWAIKAHAKGGINTYSWHMRNYAISGSSWDKENCVNECLPGGSVHELYMEKLEQSADFFASLKDKDGKLIPVLFRPFHEMGGSWFWWGEGNCTTEEYKTIFRFTVDYFRKKGLNQMIIVYSPDKFSDAEDYLKYYPGDDYVDIMAFDDYGLQKRSGMEGAIKRLEILDSISTAHNKPMAISETGLRQQDDPNWYSEVILPVLEANESTGKAAWILLWRNGPGKEHWGPSPGFPATEDFKKFMDHPRMLSLSELSCGSDHAEGHDKACESEHDKGHEGCGGTAQTADGGSEACSGSAQAADDEHAGCGESESGCGGSAQLVDADQDGDLAIKASSGCGGCAHAGSAGCGK